MIAGPPGAASRLSSVSATHFCASGPGGALGGFCAAATVTQPLGSTWDAKSFGWLVQGETLFICRIPPVRSMIPQRFCGRPRDRVLSDLLVALNTVLKISLTIFFHIKGISICLNLIEICVFLAKTPSGGENGPGSPARRWSWQWLSPRDQQFGDRRWNEITAKSGVSGFRAHVSRRSSAVLTRDVESSSSGSTIVAMMQTTQPWHRNHLVTTAGIFLCFTTRRRSLF
jgi:hypothetical protein